MSILLCILMNDQIKQYNYLKAFSNWLKMFWEMCTRNVQRAVFVWSFVQNISYIKTYQTALTFHNLWLLIICLNKVFQKALQWLVHSPKLCKHHWCLLIKRCTWAHEISLTNTCVIKLDSQNWLIEKKN